MTKGAQGFLLAAQAVVSDTLHCPEFSIEWILAQSALKHLKCRLILLFPKSRSDLWHPVFARLCHGGGTQTYWGRNPKRNCEADEGDKFHAVFEESRAGLMKSA